MEEEMNIEKIMQIASSSWVRKSLVIAVELDVFTKIKNGLQTADKIAAELGAKTGNVERLLNACTALGLISKETDRYKTLPVTEKHLVKGSPAYLGDFILMTDSLAKKWDNLKDCIVNDTKSMEINKTFEDPVFTRAMHNNSIGPAMVLAEKLDLSAYKQLLDLGGGSAAFSIALTNKNKDLKATVFELPKVCVTANQYIESLGDKSRVKTLPGDFMNSDLPDGTDVALLSHILHAFGVSECKTLIKRIYDVLPENGMLIINDFLLNEDRAGPVFPALFALNMLIETEKGDAYTKGQISEWLTESGFKDIQVISSVGPQTAIVAKK